MKYITIHNDAMPGPLKEYTIDCENMDDSEILESIELSLKYQNECIANPDEFMMKIYGED